MRLLLVIALFQQMILSAQDKFEGILTYNVTIEGENEEMLREVMPHTYTLYFGNDNFRFDLDGGMMPEFMGDIITFNPVERSYIINEETSTAYLINDDENNSVGSDYEITALTDTLLIKGYHCRGYDLEFTSPNDGLIKQRLWLTNELNVNLPAGNNHGISAFFRKELEGFALMIENFFESDIGKYRVLITLNQLEKTSLPNSLFSIPDHFKIKALE